MISTGYILDGVYHKGDSNIAALSYRRAATDKQYDHDRQREAHRIDLIQPWNSDGTLNDEFRTYYPEEAEKYGNNQA